ncbi:HD-GYP domain-containing protein [Arcobacter aquimarinus]|uniref:Two-component system response regulator c-di-GMP phosphodiesterase, RpfG family n=1 Tax=Arcobacter aquimarinus TaxID=1315211 RepID=A0AAE7B4M9_9BACT|nr:two-component system response regulator [Arcobacter aquimarinus]QKE25490.1 two-component system response regulator c-di-GMP phosphodiesterase, RpfG family [Arcobacter aquimarinus]RXI35861.1 two-component system response regulator [Arcobacter aquimarinus]
MQQNEFNKKIILVIDDTPDNLFLVTNLLKDLYTVKVANSGEKALQFLNETLIAPDLILLDIMMPVLNGYDVLKKIKENPKLQNIPVVFLTAKSSVEDEKLGFDLGANDYITKPISPPILLARVKTQLENKAISDFLRDKNEFLEKEIEKRTKDVVAIQNVTIFAMASLAETRDNETGNHIKRTSTYVKMLAKKLQNHPKFKAYLTDEMIDTLYKSAPLHDIGKIGIPDHILLKPGKLTPEEFEIMKTHTTLGKEAIEHAEKELGYEVDFLKTAKEIAYSHQEKYDGSGYPLGLKGDEIPISARLMSIADVYDALRSKRIYKNSLNLETTLKIMKEGRGSHFDPDMLDAFLEIYDEIEVVASNFVD